MASLANPTGRQDEAAKEDVTLGSDAVDDDDDDGHKSILFLDETVKSNQWAINVEAFLEELKSDLLGSAKNHQSPIVPVVGGKDYDYSEDDSASKDEEEDYSTDQKHVTKKKKKNTIQGDMNDEDLDIDEAEDYDDDDEEGGNYDDDMDYQYTSNYKPNRNGNHRFDPDLDPDYPYADADKVEKVDKVDTDFVTIGFWNVPKSSE